MKQAVRGTGYSLLYTAKAKTARAGEPSGSEREAARARLPSGARPTAFLPPSESPLHSSYRPLSLPLLCIAPCVLSLSLLFARDSFKPPSRLLMLLPRPPPFPSSTSLQLVGRPAPPVSRSGPNFSQERRLNTRLCHLPSPLNLAALSSSSSFERGRHPTPRK